MPRVWSVLVTHASCQGAVFQSVSETVNGLRYQAVKWPTSGFCSPKIGVLRNESTFKLAYLAGTVK
jgi:hypothetical protein